jgi:hypothetical protein
MISKELKNEIELKSKLSPVQIRRISNAENRCKKSMTDWSKNYWFNVFKKLCEKYDAMDYFRKVIH